jgi:2-polyprenyl-3-methyl-5-hydroxy-6-metoxy-1,4-benzoquinol methylase
MNEIEDKALALVLRDEPLEALKLLEHTSSPLKDRLLRKLDHIFNPKIYSKKYAEDPMGWRPEKASYPRYDWVLDETAEARSLLDLGCYEGTLVRRFGPGAKGVEICLEAVKLGKERGLNIVWGNVNVYKDPEKYDAVVCCEVIEHVPDPKKLVKNMLTLVSPKGWCYITTPNGCYDPANTLKSWNIDTDLIDHVRTYNTEKVAKLMEGLEYKLVENDKELWIKFRKPLDKHD